VPFSFRKENEAVSDAQHDKHSPAKDFRVPADNAWAHAWKMAAAMGAVGVLIALVGYSADPRRFAFSYLTAFMAVMTLGLGATFFVLLQHLTGAGWSVTVRRSAEFLSAGMIVLPLLFLPNLVSVGELFPWWHHEPTVAHAQEHADHGDHDHHDHGGEGHGEQHGEHQGSAAAHGSHGGAHTPEHAAHEAILNKKLAYLSPGFFYARAVIVLLAWLWLSQTFFRFSTSQDKDGDPKWTVKAARLAPAATFVFALSLTFGGFDWVMSLEPNWYSTMFGVRVFGASAVLGLAAIILVALGLRRTGVVRNEINVEHFHDLGKLLFGVLVFWAYVSFCEFMLIWYASIPEETAYFHRRWDFPTWQMISVTIVVVKFIVPFFLIMSRNAKRNLGLLGFGAGWIAALHLVELYYWVMPYYAPGGDAPLSAMGVATDVGCVLACVGIYLAVVFRRMLNHPVIPIRDPRLARSLEFINA
jgi:hypothetical protein